MVLVMFGAPGVGKGSQASILSRTLTIPHISTGDLLRENVAKGTELGNKAKGYMDSGALVPDDITIGLFQERIRRDDCKNGFILDGFPRTLSQAEYLDAMLKAESIPIDAVVNISLDDEAIVARLCGRRVCPACNEVYHILYNKPSKDGVCDKCGGDLIQRVDDSEATIRNRLKVYHAQTQSLLAYYRSTRNVVDVASQEEITDTTKQMFGLLNLEYKG